jgi:Ca-activated chloride channel family protein
VRKLEDLYILGRQSKAKLERQIVDTSLRFGVLCRFTAFVAVDRDEVVNQGGDLHRVTQAVEVPSGWAGLLKSPPVDASYDTKTRTGVLPPAMSPGKTVAMDTSMLGAPPPVRRAPHAQAPAPPPASSPTGGRGPSPGSSLAQGATRALRSVAEAARKLTSAGKKKAAPKRRAEPSPPAEAPADEGLDLSAYQRRAKALRRELEEASVDLGAFALRLKALVEDLQSVACPKHLVEPLDAARQALSEALDGGDAEAVDEARGACADALQDFIDHEKRGGGKRSREDFWK